MRRFSQEELLEAIRSIQEEIINNDYLFAGEDHQNSLTGMPIFEDGTCFRASMRAWHT